MCVTENSMYYASELLKDIADNMKRDILLERRGIVMVDGNPHILPKKLSKRVPPKSSKKGDLKSWLRIHIPIVYSKFYCFQISYHLESQMPYGSYFRWNNYKVIYDVVGVQTFNDPEKLTVNECRELYDALQNGKLKFFTYGSEPPTEVSVCNQIPIN
jgi:hypothetical protein